MQLITWFLLSWAMTCIWFMKDIDIKNNVFLEVSFAIWTCSWHTIKSGIENLNHQTTTENELDGVTYHDWSIFGVFLRINSILAI